MVKVTRPLFSDTAHGSFADIGTFRRGRHGPEFIKIGGGGGIQPERQERLKACFAEAKAAHAQLPKIKVRRGNYWRWIIETPWPEFWAQWRIDHPECNQ
jgi:hypothetical protein